MEFTGATVPKDPIVTLSSEVKYCGKTLPAEKYMIKDKMIENVVVYLTEVKSGKAMPTEPLTLTNIKCLFSPHVAVGFKGGKIIQKNDDAIFHNSPNNASAAVAITQLCDSPRAWGLTSMITRRINARPKARPAKNRSEVRR